MLSIKWLGMVVTLLQNEGINLETLDEQVLARVPDMFSKSYTPQQAADEIMKASDAVADCLFTFVYDVGAYSGGGAGIIAETRDEAWDFLREHESGSTNYWFFNAVYKLTDKQKKGVKFCSSWAS